MDDVEIADAVGRVAALVKTHYLDPPIALELSRLLVASVAEGRYPTDPAELAEAVTTDLQSINGDKHLRLLYHDAPVAPRIGDSDESELAAMAAWAAQTCSGVARVEHLSGNVGYLDLQPVLFPVAQCGDVITAAMTLLAPTEALIIDLRSCIGGDPAMVAFICSYLHGPDPVQLTGLLERGRLTQSWTLPYVPGRRYGADKPIYVLTSGKTFSGGEQLAYDLQQSQRATIVGQRTGGGAHAREGFVVHPHLEATISVARGVNPVTESNWEGTGIVPDVETSTEDARNHAHKLAQLPQGSGEVPHRVNHGTVPSGAVTATERPPV
ncbi:MAG: S41 family peptidase [Marmoricola sp.]